MTTDGVARPPRRARRTPCVALLYESATPYYDAYAGSERARAGAAGGVWARGGHAASWEVCRVATVGGARRRAGRLSGRRGRPPRRPLRPARRSARCRRGACPALSRHLRAAGARAASAVRACYVDALAVDPRGAAAAWPRRCSMRPTAGAPRRRAATGVALDTGLENTRRPRALRRRGLPVRESGARRTTGSPRP